jgi:Alpha-galactosidase
MIKRTVLSVFLIAFAFIVNAQIISIQTASTSLVYTVKNKKVYQLHYGKKLNGEQGLAQMPVVLDEIYPSFGNGNSNEVALIAKHDDGTMATDLYYVSHEQVKDENKITTTIHLKDEKKPFFVDIHIVAYVKEDVIEQWGSIHHNEKSVVRLDQYASSVIGFKAPNYYLSHFYGSWAKEMNLLEEPLVNGVKCIESQRGVRATEFENPSFILSLNQKASEDFGEVIMGALAWTGNFKLSFQVNDQGNCQIFSGINPLVSNYNLASGKDLVTPRMILTFSDSGKNTASINLHRWARKYNLRNGNQDRPIVMNSWEGAYFNFNDQKLKSMMDGAAEMGVELFVLDDGWFGNKYPRNNDKMGLGDWQINQKKLPNGLGDLIDYAEKLGMKFGIWVEPEMVNPNSELAKKHPEWILQRGNDRELLLERNQYLLDLSNPKVQEFVFGVVDNLLTQNPGIAYIKWDCNSYLQNFGSVYLNKTDQSHLWVDYTKGLESVLQKLTQKYPKVAFQACASGGGRVDYGVLKYSDEFWASDDTDPYQRLFIQWGTNHIYPAIGTAAHVTKSPNDQTKRTTPLKFRFDVALGGRLGLELLPSDLKSDEISFIKNGIKLYKNIRSVIQQGDLYRLQSPYDRDGYTAINYVTQTKDTAVLMVYSLEWHRKFEKALVRMKGLNEKYTYKVTEVNQQNGKVSIGQDGQLISGSALMNNGLSVNIKQPFSSSVFVIEKCSE